MNIVQIKQQNNLLQTTGTNILAYQYSSNINIELSLEENSQFKTLVKTVTVNIPGLKKTVSCNADWNKNPAVVTLPQDVFKCEGMIYIALFGTDEKGCVVNTNPLGFQIDESNSTITVVCDDDKLLEQKVIDIMTQWYEIKIKPDYELLKKNAEDQQVALNQRIEAFDDKIDEIDTKVDDGDFDGATIRHGLLDPTNDIGKDGDQYLNTSTTSYHLFFKENGTWIDKGSIRGIDGNNKILVGNELETSQPKTLFIQTITQAQAIAETRGITVNEYDARLPMSQVRINDEVGSQGLDEYISKKVVKTLDNFELSQRGMILLKEVDLNTITLPGSYYCDTCTNVPINESWYLEVMTHHNNSEYATQIITSVNYDRVFQRKLVDGVWRGWKLIAGEVLLWSGDVTTGAVNIAQSTSAFKHLSFETSDGIAMEGIITAGTIRVIASDVYETNCYVRGITATISSTTINIIRPYSYTINGAKTVIKTTKIIGLP